METKIIEIDSATSLHVRGEGWYWLYRDRVLVATFYSASEEAAISRAREETYADLRELNAARNARYHRYADEIGVPLAQRIGSMVQW